MSKRERMNRAREYSRSCCVRRLRKILWAVDAALLVGLLIMALWCFRADRQHSAAEAAETTAEATEVTPSAAVISAIPAQYLKETVQGGTFEVTGYCACCTPYADMNRDESGRVLTASGEWVTVGECVAVDPEIIPLGSSVSIGGKTYTALDTGVYGHVVDILMSHEEARCAGVREEWVTWE